MSILGPILGSVASSVIGKALNSGQKNKYVDPRSPEQIALQKLLIQKYRDMINLDGKLPAAQKQVLLGNILGQVDNGYADELNAINNSNFDPITKNRLRFKAGRDRARNLGAGWQQLNEYGLSQYNNALTGANQVSNVAPPQNVSNITPASNIGSILGDEIGSAISYAWGNRSNTKQDPISYNNEFGAGSGYNQDWGAKFKY